MTVVLSMSAVYNNHHRVCGDDSAPVSSRDLTFNFVSSTPSSRPGASTAHNVCVSDALSASGCTQIHQSGRVKGDVRDDSDFDGDSRGIKRKVESEEDKGRDKVPCRRISPFLNTPKQRKEERRKVLKISIQKLRQMEDPEHFLRRSVLINNTVKKMQTEMREEKVRAGCVANSNRNYTLYRRRASLDYEVLNNSYLSSASSVVYDEPIHPEDTGKITDDMTDTLVHSLEGNLTSESPLETFSSDSQREKQIYSDMDTVFNNLIRALGET